MKTHGSSASCWLAALGALTLACSPTGDTPANSLAGTGAAGGTASAASAGAAGSGGAGGGQGGTGAAEVDLCPSSQCALPYANCNQDLADGCEVDVMADRYNCGLCGRACSLYGTCVGGVCQTVIVNFFIGESCGEEVVLADCDGISANKYETVLTSDPKNCGGCGIECTAGVPCAAGKCGCAPDVLCDGVCANLETDPVHCGACGVVCPDPDLGDDQAARCVDGSCALGCQEECGKFDCDNDPTTACVPLGTVENCSACGDACGSGVPCIGGACCDPATYATDENNCGECGLNCQYQLEQKFGQNYTLTVAPNSFTSTCEEGVCKAECLSPHLDCNGDLDADISDGCETNGARDPAHCGACGTSCVSGQVCLFGVCATQPCDEVPR